MWFMFLQKKWDHTHFVHVPLADVLLSEGVFPPASLEGATCVHMSQLQANATENSQARAADIHDDAGPEPSTAKELKQQEPLSWDAVWPTHLLLMFQWELLRAESVLVAVVVTNIENLD